MSEKTEKSSQMRYLRQMSLTLTLPLDVPARPMDAKGLIDVPPCCPTYMLAEIEVTRFGGGDGYALVGQCLRGGGGLISLITVLLTGGRVVGAVFHCLCLCVCLVFRRGEG